jgi:hypothetical protein
VDNDHSNGLPGVNCSAALKFINVSKDTFVVDIINDYRVPWSTSPKPACFDDNVKPKCGINKDRLFAVTNTEKCKN